MKSKIYRDGHLKINTNSMSENKIDAHMRSSLYTLHTWYTNKTYGAIMLLVLLAIDVSGFYQIVSNTLFLSSLMRVVVISGFGVAFEIAPLYIGYALCLQLYSWGNSKLNNIIFRLSLSAFVLGVISNTVYRVLTIESAYDGYDIETAIATTVIMCILPVITSFINLIIGCLAFDPLYIQLLKLSKQIAVLKERERQITAYIHEYENDNYLKATYIEQANSDYNTACDQIQSIQEELLSYIDMHSLDNQGDK